MNNEIWTLDQCAKELEVHPCTLARLAREGKIPGKKVGREWRFSKNYILKWLGNEAPTKIVDPERRFNG